MNMTAKEVVEFVNALKGRVADADSEVVEYLCMLLERRMLGSNIKVTAQNMHWRKGCITEKFPPMLADLELIMLRKEDGIGETDETVIV